MSSDDEDQKASRRWSGRYWDLATPSPGAIGQVFLRRAASHRKASINTHTARQSMSSAQTNVTSASLPFMLRVMPTFEGAPPLPDTPPATTPDCLPMSYFALTGRLPGSSGAASPVSETRMSALTSSDGAARSNFMFTTPPHSAASRLMAVTEEEMALLEMMRRKRGQMQDQRESHQTTQSSLASPTHAPALVPLPLRLAKRKDSNARPETPSRPEEQRKGSTSSTITLENGENIEFPTPPTTSRPGSSKKSHDGSRKPSLDRAAPSPIREEASNTPAAKEEEEGEEVDYHVPRQGSYWSPEIPTPATDTAAELDSDPFGAPFVSATSTSRPGTSTSARLRNLLGNHNITRKSTAAEDAANQFLIEFGDLKLLPLYHPGSQELPSTPDIDEDEEDKDKDSGTSSPGLTDGDSSSCGRTSRNEAETPNKVCTFTANAFEIVDSDNDGYESFEVCHSPDSPATTHYTHRREPLLSKVDNMYAFAAETREVVSIALDPKDAFRISQQRQRQSHLTGNSDADRASSRIDVNVLNAFHTPNGYTAVR